MPTTAYAVTITPPVAGGFYVPVEVRFEHAAAPAAEPNPNPAYLVRDGSTPLQGRTLISDVTTFYFVATTAVLLTTWASGDDQSKQSVTPTAYATPTAVALGPTSSGTPSADLSSRYVAQVDTQTTGVEKRVWEVQAAGTGKGKFFVSIFDNTYVSVPDPTLYIGYNTTASGTLPLAGEPGLAYGIEADYNDGSGQNKIETYLQYTPESGGFYVRPFFFQINRTTKQVTSATLRGSYANGLLIEQDDGTTNGISVARLAKAAATVYGFAGVDTSLSLLAGASRSSSIQFGYNAATSAMAVGPVSATIGGVTVGGSLIAQFFSTPIGAAGAAMSVGVQDNAAVITADVVASNAGVKGLVVRCKSTQTANAFEVQDSGSTARIKITKATASVAPSLVIGSAALATSATDGFVYLPTCAGTPTGVPRDNTGTCAMVYDTTNNKLCVYNGGWKQVTLA